MPDIRLGGIFRGGVLTAQNTFKPGDMPPPGNGYLEMQEWAEVQLKAGLRQKACGCCGAWAFPQQLAARKFVFRGFTSKGETVERHLPMCLKCETKADDNAAKEGE